MSRTLSREDILQSADTEGVRYVRLQFTDLLGTIKNVEIPVRQLPKALDNRIMFDGSSIEGFVRIEESDMYLRPDPDSWLIFPWHPEGGKVGRLICDVYLADGTPFAGDPRGVLKRVLKEAEVMGFSTLKVGLEPEFFLLKLDPSGEPTDEPNDFGGYFDFAPLDLGETCRRDIVLALQEMGFKVAASHHEVSPGQHEIDFQYADAITAADDITTFKLVVKTVARQHNLHATFMPKPMYGHNGSGMHCHQSLWVDNQNVFADPTHPLGLSTTALHYISGVMAHAGAITAVANPIVNSYKRLVPGYEAPVYVAWSDRNRSPWIRVPSSRGASTRIELRSPDPAANPYLAIAVMLKAGLHGIANQLPTPAPVHQNIFSMTEEERLKRGIFTLPTNLEEALQALHEDEVIQSALGEYTYRHYVQAKVIEWEMYRTVVHPWEHEQYLRRY